MTKSNYQLFTQRIDKILEKYQPIKDTSTYFKRIIKTNRPFGNIEVSIWELTGKERFYTIFTKVDKPYLVLNSIKSRVGFNADTGKYNSSDKNLENLCNWLESYLSELLCLKSELIGA